MEEEDSNPNNKFNASLHYKNHLIAECIWEEQHCNIKGIKWNETLANTYPLQVQSSLNTIDLEIVVKPNIPKQLRWFRTPTSNIYPNEHYSPEYSKIAVELLDDYGNIVVDNDNIAKARVLNNNNKEIIRKY